MTALHTGYTKLDSQICYADHCTACATDLENARFVNHFTKRVYGTSPRRMNTAPFATNQERM